MRRMTAKYWAALDVATAEGIPERGDALYTALTERKYVWNRTGGAWEKAPEEVPPTEFVRIRVWADAALVDQAALAIAAQLQWIGLKLVEKSDVYLFKPPKQREGLVYLTLLPKERPS